MSRPLWWEEESRGRRSPAKTVANLEALWGDEQGEPEIADQEELPTSLWDREELTTSGGEAPSDDLDVDLWRSDEGKVRGSPRSPISPPLRSDPIRAARSQADEFEEEPVSRPRRRGKRSARHAHRPRRRIAAWTVFVLALATLADAAYVTMGLRDSLGATEEGLEDATRALEKGDIATARELLSAAEDRTDTAAGLVKHPSFVLASWLPWVGNDPRALEGLVDAAGLSTRAGLSAADAADAMGVTGEDLAAAVYDEGVVQFDAIDAGTPFVSTIEGLLTDAVEALESAPVPHLDLLGEILDQAESEVTRAQRAAHKSRVLFSSLPSLLGRDGERRYMLAFQALGEARATGGLIGQYGILKADGGRLTLEEIAPIGSVFPNKIPPVDAPRWFRVNYGPQTALRQIQQTNVSPNFPAVAEVVLRMYESVTGQSLDGLLAMDPVTLSYLLESTGPIDSPQLGIQVTAQNVVDVVMRRSYLAFDKDRQQDRFLAGLVREFWNKVHDGELEAAPFVQGLSKASQTQHLMVYSRDQEDQDAMAEIDSDGDYGTDISNVQLVFHNNYGPNKVDYFLTRSTDTLVQLTAEGGARFTTTVTLENSAPPGPASLLLGNFPDRAPPGTNRMTLHVLMPRGARVIDYAVDGENLFPLRFRDESHPIAWQLFDIPAGETTIATIVYEVFDLADLDADGGRLDLRFVPQTTVVPDDFSVKVVPPPGLLIRSADDASSPFKSVFKFEGKLDSVRDFTLDLAE